ncbi:MAG: hypothetical protein ACREQ5_32580 [Candidatus Dormibacteria bacterium]
MSPSDPIDAAAAAKRTATLLRDARSLLRRADKLAAAALDLEEPGPHLIADARAAVERVVDYLARLERTQQRKAHEALRWTR